MSQENYSRKYEKLLLNGLSFSQTFGERRTLPSLFAFLPQNENDNIQNKSSH
jgi:hypothetical protein